MGYVVRCFVTPDEAPWVEHEGKRFVLRLLDPVKNARRKRPPRSADVRPLRRTGFDPPRTLLLTGKMKDLGEERGEL